MAVIVTPLGLAVLNSRPEVAEVAHWQGAWCVLVAATAVSLLVAPTFALLEGCGRVAEVARFRLRQDIGGYVACWILLARRAGSAAYAALAVVRALASVGWSAAVGRKARGAGQPTAEPVAASIRRELWPMQ